ncbi:MAG: transposase [Planctomycetota bacterium]|nr:MAG: transposase [Planctomycetota bacterium]
MRRRFVSKTGTTLIEHVPISEVCARHGLQPTVFYQWHKKLFEGGASDFENARSGRPKSDASAKRIEALEAKLAEKNEVVAELMAEHVALKKGLGELWPADGPRTMCVMKS